MKFFFRGCLIFILVLIWIWGGFALYFSGPGSLLVKVLLAGAFGALLPITFLLSRSFLRGLFLCCLYLVVFFAWWNNLQPTNDKDWAADVAQISHGEIIGDKLIMQNIRDFRYSAESTFEERWQSREYDLNNFRGLDLFLSYWASDNIAHIILSWDFGDDGHLAISIETRKDKTQEYSAIKGFFKQFELSYVAADERDIIKLRTNYRKERVYLYRLKTSKEKARALLEDYLKEMNRLVEEPAFYNALTRNCATSVHLHVEAIHPDETIPLDWRLIFSGHLDELMYEYQAINEMEMPFEELRKKSRVDLRMRKYSAGDFSEMIRQVPDE